MARLPLEMPSTLVGIGALTTTLVFVNAPFRELANQFVHVRALFIACMSFSVPMAFRVSKT